MKPISIWVTGDLQEIDFVEIITQPHRKRRLCREAAAIASCCFALSTLFDNAAGRLYFSPITSWHVKQPFGFAMQKLCCANGAERVVGVAGGFVGNLDASRRCRWR